MNKIVIDVKHLNKSFNGKPAVIDLNLQVREGEICGFLGPNGSGKTTTLRMLCGLLIPDSGEGHCLGFDILTESYAIKSRVGYMTQSFSLYHDLTAYENLDFIARMFQIKHRKEKIRACLKEFNLEDRQNQITGTLSGGWKQRLALAGCLLHEPKLLLLDEPTAGVDPKARREFWDEIHQLSAQGITTLVSTHYMDEAERCTKLAYISYGVLLAEGTLKEIIDKTKLYTWQVHGDNLIALSEKLKKLPGITLVAFFGSTLHVSGLDKNLLEKTIHSVQTPDQTWKEIQPGLEDVFIHLVQDNPKQKEKDLL
ncbi:MAG TPA: ABC transporter ATP-binding protein [Gammaproteobacteria bacterium]|jgi:ABC-2 type transport system ATP-binding protein|nr:ABC transporter ATP-binding protein [Gammaproteobacteria bacterium]